jgi:hypothetical protein
MSRDEIIHGDIVIRSNSETNVRRFVQMLLESVGPSRLTFEEQVEQDEKGDWLAYGELAVYIPGPVPPDWRKR